MATLSEDEKNQKYKEIRYVLEDVKNYADTYENRSLVTKEHLETFKRNLIEDQERYKDMDELLAKTEKMSKDGLEKLLLSINVTKEEIKKLELQREEQHNKTMEKLDSIKSKAVKDIAIDSKLMLNHYILVTKRHPFEIV